jgi:predicted RNA binding protein YcfA (HicA-like mRNA interferase family)
MRHGAGAGLRPIAVFAYPTIVVENREQSVYIYIYCKASAVNSRDVIRKLEEDGWRKVRQRGSHVQLKHPSKPGVVTVPHPKRELPAGTLRSITRQSGVQFS